MAAATAAAHSEEMALCVIGDMVDLCVACRVMRKSFRSAQLLPADSFLVLVLCRRWTAKAGGDGEWYEAEVKRVTETHVSFTYIQSSDYNAFDESIEIGQIGPHTRQSLPARSHAPAAASCSRSS
jgi:hypothetical protein